MQSVWCSTWRRPWWGRVSDYPETRHGSLWCFYSLLPVWMYRLHIIKEVQLKYNVQLKYKSKNKYNFISLLVYFLFYFIIWLVLYFILKISLKAQKFKLKCFYCFYLFHFLNNCFAISFYLNYSSKNLKQCLNNWETVFHII